MQLNTFYSILQWAAELGSHAVFSLLARSLIHSLIHALMHLHIYSLSHSTMYVNRCLKSAARQGDRSRWSHADFSPRSLIHSLTHTLTSSFTHSLAHSFIHSLTLSFTSLSLVCFNKCFRVSIWTRGSSSLEPCFFLSSLTHSLTDYFCVSAGVPEWDVGQGDRHRGRHAVFSLHHRRHAAHHVQGESHRVKVHRVIDEFTPQLIVQKYIVWFLRVDRWFRFYKIKTLC